MTINYPLSIINYQLTFKFHNELPHILFIPDCVRLVDNLGLLVVGHISEAFG